MPHITLFYKQARIKQMELNIVKIVPENFKNLEAQKKDSKDPIYNLYTQKPSNHPKYFETKLRCDVLHLYLMDQTNEQISVNILVCLSHSITSSRASTKFDSNTH